MQTSTDSIIVGSQKQLTSRSFLQAITSLVLVIVSSNSNQPFRPWNSPEAQAIVHPFNPELRMDYRSPSRPQFSSSCNKETCSNSTWNTERIIEVLAKNMLLKHLMMLLLATMQIHSSRQQIQLIQRWEMIFRLLSQESATLMFAFSRYLVLICQISSKMQSRKQLCKIMKSILP